jgi:hypothetical protein
MPRISSIKPFATRALGGGLTILRAGFRLLAYGPHWKWIQANKWAWFSALGLGAFSVASMNEFWLASVLFTLGAVSCCSQLWSWSPSEIHPPIVIVIKSIGSAVIFGAWLAFLLVLNVYRADRPWSQLPMAIAQIRSVISPDSIQLDWRIQPPGVPVNLTSLEGNDPANGEHKKSAVPSPAPCIDEALNQQKDMSLSQLLGEYAREIEQDYQVYYSEDGDEWNRRNGTMPPNFWEPPDSKDIEAAKKRIVALKNGINERMRRRFCNIYGILQVAAVRGFAKQTQYEIDDMLLVKDIGMGKTKYLDVRQVWIDKLSSYLSSVEQRMSASAQRP